MNNIKGSWAYKLLVHSMLFLSGLILIISTHHVVTYLDSYSTTIKSVSETALFQSKYLKYVERVAVYVDYREKGYNGPINVDSSSLDLESLFEDDQRTDELPTTQEEQQEEFDYYNTVLNIANTNFLYYVKNLNTGNIYASKELTEVVNNHLKSEDQEAAFNSYLKSVRKNEAYLILNTKTKKFLTNVNRSYQYLNEENLSWVIDYITGNLITSEDGNNDYDDYIICTTLSDNITNYEDEFGAMVKHFKTSNEKYMNSLYLIPLSFVSLLIFFVLAIAFCGYKKDRNHVSLNGFDKLKTEVGFLLVVAGIILLVYFTQFISKILLMDFYLDITIIYIVAYIFIYPFCMFGLLSFIRRCKANVIIKNSYLAIFLGRLKKFLRAFFAEHSLTYPLAALLIIFIAIEILAVYLYRHPIVSIYESLVVAIIGLLLLGYKLFNVAIDINIVTNETKGLTEGDISHKINTTTMCGPVATLGEYINNIGDGLSAAVDEKLKSERLKTELIANVSHDIKTPLTSIINYVDLLKKENLNNDKAKDYLDILSSKSWRLKTLIEDLVEASKASSGTITLNLECLNLVELVRQSLGEFEDRFISHNLEAVLTIQEEPVYILADGRSTYRIIENIFSNVNKYALSGTRIYIDILTKQSFVTVSVKNISATKLNINADELMERFVRGDLSRNTEGSGLGLSIAKSLASLQDATFDILLDGDLFKAVVKFKRLLEPTVKEEGNKDKSI